jgi:hypothetical protein
VSAETRILVEVLRVVKDRVEVSAVTLHEARSIAECLPGVARVLRAYYPEDAPTTEAEE